MNKSNSSEEKELHLYKETEVKVPIHLKITLTIKEAAEYSNIGINKIDSMLKQPNCPFVLYVGTRKLVKRKDFMLKMVRVKMDISKRCPKQKNGLLTQSMKIHII